MNRYPKFLVVSIFILVNICAFTSEPNSYDSYINISIQDFLKNSPLSKTDKAFSVDVQEFNNRLIGVSIYGSTIKPWAVKKGNFIDLSFLPNKTVEEAGKLFYWRDTIGKATSKNVALLKKFNYLDTAIVDIYIPDYYIDDAKKAEQYYFCKCDPTKFKRIRTRRAMGRYPLPDFKCKCKN